MNLRPRSFWGENAFQLVSMIETFAQITNITLEVPEVINNYSNSAVCQRVNLMIDGEPGDLNKFNILYNDFLTYSQLATGKTLTIITESAWSD